MLARQEHGPVGFPFPGGGAQQMRMGAGTGRLEFFKRGQESVVERWYGAAHHAF